MKLPSPFRVVRTASGDELYGVNGERIHNVRKVTVGAVSEGKPTTVTLELDGPVVVEEMPKAAEAPKAGVAKDAAPAKADAAKSHQSP